MTDTEQHPLDLLPWYVNGSLSAGEQQQVAAHLQGCEACRAEVELLRAMRDVSKQVTEPVPGEFAWQRLQRDMRQEKTMPAPRRQWWLPSLAAAAVLVIAVQGVLLFNFTQEDGYGLAGGGHDGVVVQVKFNAQATEADIRALLHAAGAEIIAGPGASGVYRLRLVAQDSGADLQARYEQLQANRDVIDYLQTD